MAINKRKVLEAARKHAQKGAQAKALKEFDKLLKLDPRDARLRLEIGDAHRRWGNIDKAIDTYTKVADQYTKEGFDARAVAVYKQIHNLDSEAFETYEPLAELYQRMGLAGEAILALQTAADGYRKQGKKREALELLRRMAALDPSNTTSRIKVADLLRQEGMNEEATAEYSEASGELERQGDREGAANAYGRILELDPDHIDTMVKLADNLLACGQAERAEPLAKRALEANPDEPERYELLASVYRSQKRDDELVATYRKLSDLYKQRGDDEQARDILQRYVPSEEFEATVGIDESIAFGAMGSDIDLGDSGTFDEPGESVSAMLDTEADPGAAVVEERDLAEETCFDPNALEPSSPSAMEEVLFDDEAGDIDGPSFDAGLDEDLALELDEPLESPEPAGEAPKPAAPPPPAGDPDQLLAEASVYLRYGKRERAIANLEAILEQEPEHFAALEKLGEAFADDGDGERAVETWLRAAEVARSSGDDSGLSVLRDRIGAIDAEAAASLGVAEAATADEDVVQVADAPAADVAIEPEAPEIEIDDIEIDIDDVDIDIDIDDSDFEDESASMDGGEPQELTNLDDELEIDAPPAAAQSEAPPLEEGFDASSSMVEQITEDLEEADFYLKQGLTDEAEVIFQRILSVAPNHPLALLRLGEMAAARGEDPGSSGSDSIPAVSDETTPVPSGEDAAPVAAIDDELGLSEDEDSEPVEIDVDLSLESDPEPEPEPQPEIEPELEPVPVALDAEPQVSSDDSEAGLEDDLAAQFLAEVTGSDGVDPVVAADAEDGADAEEEPEPEPIEVAPPEAVVPEKAAPEPEPAVAAATDDPDPEPEVDPGDTFTAPEDSKPISEEVIGEAPDLVVPAVAEEADPEDSFDLAAEITDALDGDDNAASMSGLGDSADGFAAVFSQFKEGVSQTLSEGDHEAHFDLGIAYREMGLHDDAKGEFRAAMGNADREIECRHMLGLCSFEQGQYEEAVAQYEQISRAESANAEQILSSQYELGRSWEALGDRERARVAFDAVADEDPDFCDVTERLAALDEPEKPEAEADAGEDFESFEDLISDDSDDEDDDDATGTETEAEQVDYETFDDIMGEDDDEDPEPSATVDAPDEAPGVEAQAAEEPVVEPEVVEAEPEPAESPEPPPKKKAKKKRKKISFV